MRKNNNRHSLEPGKRLHRERGLTFLEIMVVLVIIGLISTMIGGRVFSMGDKAKVKLTNVQLTKIKGNIDTTLLDNNPLPSDLRSIGLDPKESKDAWGRDIMYRSVDGRGYELKSLGADGREGGSGSDADIIVTGP